MEERVQRRQKSLTPSLLDKHFASAFGEKEDVTKRDEDVFVEPKISPPNPNHSVPLIPPQQKNQMATLIPVKMELSPPRPLNAPATVHSKEKLVLNDISSSVSVVENNVIHEIPPQPSVINNSAANYTQNMPMVNSSSQEAHVPQQLHPLPTNMPTQSKQILPSSMPNTSSTSFFLETQNFLPAPKKAAAINSDDSGSVGDRTKKKSLDKRKLRAHSTNLAMQGFWKRMLQEMHCVDEETVDFNDQSIPLQRCKEIFDAEKKHLNLSNIHGDSSAIVTMSKVCEMLVLELVKRSLLSRDNPEDRSPIKVEDILNAIRDNELYDLFSEHL